LLRALVGGNDPTNLTDLPEPGMGLQHRTVFPRIYSHPHKAGYCVMDTVGFEEEEDLRDMKVLLNLPKIAIIVVTASDSKTPVAKELLKMTLKLDNGQPHSPDEPLPCWLACLTALNQADSLANDDIDNLIVEVMLHENNYS
jgi:hypothetical protein